MSPLESTGREVISVEDFGARPDSRQNAVQAVQNLTSMYQFCEAVISICPEIPALGRAGASSPITIGNTL